MNWSGWEQCQDTTPLLMWGVWTPAPGSPNLGFWASWVWLQEHNQWWWLCSAVGVIQAPFQVGAGSADNRPGRTAMGQSSHPNKFPFQLL